MAVNLHDAALGLETAIRQSDEFNHLKQMYKEVNADPQAKQMFDHFRQIQMNLQQKQMMGQNISEAEVQQAQASVALIQKNEKISRLLQSEQRMSTMIGELNQLIMRPLEELYGNI